MAGAGLIAVAFALLAHGGGSTATATGPVAPGPVAPGPAAPGPAVLGAAAAPAPAAVLGLGDSVPAGQRCACTDFVHAYAQKVGAVRKTAPTVHNEAVAGATSADVRRQLDTKAVQAEVRAAATVLIMIGANDFAGPFREVSEGGVSAADGYTEVANAVQANVTAIIRRIQALHTGPVHIVVLDYWNAMADGAVARRSYSAAQTEAARSATEYANRALRQAVRATKVLYVSTWSAFKGSDGSKDPTGLLADDGDHPNAAGHSVIAGALASVLPGG